MQGNLMELWAAALLFEAGIMDKKARAWVHPSLNNYSVSRMEKIATSVAKMDLDLDEVNQARFVLAMKSWHHNHGEFNGMVIAAFGYGLRFFKEFVVDHDISVTFNDLKGSSVKNVVIDDTVFSYREFLRGDWWDWSLNQDLVSPSECSGLKPEEVQLVAVLERCMEEDRFKEHRKKFQRVIRLFTHSSPSSSEAE